MYWQRTVYFCFGQSPGTRTKWQASLTRESFLRTISFSSKAEYGTFNSRVQNKLYKTYKTDLSKKRELILTMEFQGGKQSGLIQLMKNQWHISQSHRSSTLIQAFIPAWSQLLPSSWQCRRQLLPPNNLLAQYAEWRRVYVLRWKHSDSKHLPWCMLTETYPLM